MYYYRFSFTHLLIFTILLTLIGCEGCSKSGRASLRKDKQKLSRNSVGHESKDEDAKSDSLNNKRDTTVYREITGNKSSSLSQLYNLNREGVFVVYSLNEGEPDFVQGSGFFVSSNGLAVSNRHVFEGFKSHVVKLYDGKLFNISEILEEGNDRDDFVIFKVDTKNTQVYSLNIANKNLDIGDDVFAIGNPKGLEQTLSKGIVSGYRENNQIIQTTAEITHGSSGGPLFNMQGEVVGITTAGVGEANLNFVVNIRRLPLTKYIDQ